MRHSFEPARRLGTMLGGAVVTAFESIGTTDAPEIAPLLDSRSTVLQLPAMTFQSREAGEASVTQLREEVQQLQCGPRGGAVYWAQLRIQRAEAMLNSRVTGTPLPTIEAEVNVVRVGDVAIVTAPGEIFTETGMAVKRRSPMPRTCFVGYTNGSIGYVPVPAAYDEGGYEVTHACSVDPDAAGMIEDASVAMLHELAST